MKKINYLLTVIFFTFCVMVKINAALPDSLGTISEVQNSYTKDSSNYGLALKISNQYATICTHYYSNTPAGTGVECRINNDWDEATRYGVAAIINAAKPDITMTAMTPAYFAAELAVNVFLKNIEKENVDLSATYSGLYNGYLDLADEAYEKYDTDSSVVINLSSNHLTFEKNGSQYISNTITVSGVSDYSVNKPDFAEVSKNGNEFKIIVNESAISTETTVNVTVTSTKQLAQARNYSCGDGYQTLTPNAVETKEVTGTKDISGEIIPTGSIEIKKVDEKGNNVKGAKIKIQCTSKNCNYMEIITTTSEARIIDNLQLGDYLIQEIEAPKGYELDSTSKIVKINSSKLHHEIKLVNTKSTKLEVSKLDGSTGKFLKGVILQIEDKNGNVVKYCEDANGNKNSECKWETGDEPKVITGLPYGTYYLVEVSAPTGYEIFSGKLEFSLDENNNTMQIKLENHMPDTLSSKSTLLVAISMFDIALGIGIISYVKKNKVQE